MRQSKKQKTPTDDRDNGKCGSNDIQILTTNESMGQTRGGKRCADCSSHATGANLNQRDGRANQEDQGQQNVSNNTTKQR